MTPLLLFILVLIAFANGFVLGIQYQEWLIARGEEASGTTEEGPVQEGARPQRTRDSDVQAERGEEREGLPALPQEPRADGV